MLFHRKKSLDRFVCAVVATVLSAGLAVAPAEAQSLRNADQPAEFPPSSFTGKQYVDSKGCVYIRAGIDGNTTWVPRVSRARKHVCGQTPSLGPTQRAAAAAPRPASSAPVITITNDAAPAPRASRTVDATSVTVPAPRRVVTPAPAPRVVRAPAPAPRVIVPAPQPAPRVVVSTAPAPKVVTTKRTPAQVASTCAGASAVSAQYMSSSKAVRCGPQAGGHGAIGYGAHIAPVTSRVVTHSAPTLSYGHGHVHARTKPVQDIPKWNVKRAAKHGLAPTDHVGTQALVVPKHVYAENVAEQQHTLRVPAGMKPAWEDDRLNPKRAYQTLGGKQAMELVWTRTLPRRLIDRKSKRDMTAHFPNLYYPFTSQAQLDAARLAMAQGKQVRVRVQHADPHTVTVTDTRTTTATTTINRSVVSTKSAPQRVIRQAAPQKVVTRAPQGAASHRFVQVGSYGNPANAQKAARALQSRGLPVRIGRMTSGGRQLQVVLAGPFGSQRNLNNALGIARQIGFRDAFFRK
ncbi:SPOR domain-containing protein [Pseudaestuariivita sp.]|uniref:SPOR domain-containing protein n=1 Tax=Pseudaestuariivita sp. TaxID=2211669 RepID=UPI00405A26F9